MIAEVKVLLHVDDVVEVVFVFPLYYIQNLQLNQSLVMKPADLQEMLRYWKILHVISSFIFRISRYSRVGITKCEY